MSLVAQPKLRGRPTPFARRRSLHVEALEDRQSPAVLIVTNTNDSGPGSLRQAILDSNASVGVLDTIVFNIPGSGVQTIAPTSAPPAITDPVIIDGTTQPGFAGTPLIELNGANAGVTDGLDINAGSTTIKGLVINGFGNGIVLETNGGDIVQGNYLGTNASGTAAIQNRIAGISILSSGNTIGGTASGSGNVISGNGLGNGGVGIVIGQSSVAATGNVIEGNFIGTNASGTAALGNDGGGISVENASNTTIGGVSAAARNIITSRNGAGIVFNGGAFGTATSNVVEGNYIGTDVTGTIAVGHQENGVLVEGASSQNIIGGTAEGSGNLISGNYGSGIFFSNANNGGGIGPTNNLMTGNFIGTNSAGTGIIGNGGDGIQLMLGSLNTIGGTATGARNVISGNSNGISVISCSHILIEGNFIGTNAAGTAALGNRSNGIYIAGSFILASGNTIGGTAAGAGNVISGNQGSGIEIGGNGAVQNLVQGNLIGVGADGRTDLPNAGNGVWITTSANGNTVGGTAAGAGNVIWFNGGSGVLVDNQQGFRAGVAADNGILSDSIFLNGALGIRLQLGANNNQTSPTLFSALPASGGGTIIKGSLHSTPSITFRIEFFANPTADPSAFGQGETFLGFDNVTTDANGNVTFSAVVPGTQALGQAVSATATDPNNNTSQFSHDVFVHLPARDLAGRVNETGQWWVAKSTGSSFSNQLWGGWSAAATWVDVLQGDFTGDGHDDIAGRDATTGLWWLAVSNGSGFTNQLWGGWNPNVTWVDVKVGDFNGDGKADIAGRVAETGDWWVSLSNGTGFVNQLWGNWSTAVTWKDVLVGDFNGDGRADIAGRVLESGQWWVAQSTGNNFVNQLWGAWSTAVTWVDVKVGNFNGDGLADIAGRVLESGQWWLALSTGSLFTNQLWTTWAPAVTWVDVVVGDFNGDGRTDIAGRVLESGQWWVAQSTGSSFANSLWTTWAPAVTWVDVQVGDFNGDGEFDIAGRVQESGQWWVGLSSGSQFTNQLWTAWSTAVNWVDVRVGGF